MIETFNGSEAFENGVQGRHAMAKRSLARRALDGLVHIKETIVEDFSTLRAEGQQRAALIADQTPYPDGSPDQQARNAALTAQLEIDLARYQASRSTPF